MDRWTTHKILKHWSKSHCLPGCGQPEAAQELRHLVEMARPTVVFLMETRMNKECALGLKSKLGFQVVKQ
jgi:hypothetical protein